MSVEHDLEDHAPKAGRVTVHPDADHTTITLAGEIDADLVDELRQATLDATATGLAIEIDVRAVTFMDSTGVSFFIAAARRSPKVVRVHGAGDAVRLVLQVTRVDELLELVGDRG